MTEEWTQFLTNFKPTQVVKRPVVRPKKTCTVPQDTSGTSAGTAAIVTPTITVLPVIPTMQADKSCEPHEGSECSGNQIEKENDLAPLLSVPNEKHGQCNSYTLAFKLAVL